MLLSRFLSNQKSKAMTQITELQYAKEWWKKLDFNLKLRYHERWHPTPFIEDLTDEQILHIFRKEVIGKWIKDIGGANEFRLSSEHYNVLPFHITDEQWFEIYRREVLSKEEKVICSHCNKEKEGTPTGLCLHCGRFGKASTQPDTSELDPAIAFANQISRDSEYDKGRWYGRIEGFNTALKLSDTSVMEEAIELLKQAKNQIGYYREKEHPFPLKLQQ